jgi:hypothetical protein
LTSQALKGKMQTIISSPVKGVAARNPISV